MNNRIAKRKKSTVEKENYDEVKNRADERTKIKKSPDTKVNQWLSPNNVNRHRRFTYRLVDFFFPSVRSFVRSSALFFTSSYFSFSTRGLFSFGDPIIHFGIGGFFPFSIGDFFLLSILLFTSAWGNFFFLSCSLLHFIFFLI